MLAGMPTHYHISCRVRNSEHGIDAQVTEQADEVVECSGTAFAALTKWLLNKDSWISASPTAIQSLLSKMNQDGGHGRSELEIMGWDSRDDGGDKYEDGYYNDWETGDIQIDEANHSLAMNGTSCCSEYEFEVLVTPHDPNKVSKQETGEAERPQEYTDARYLMELSERVFRIPVMHGVDQADYEELREIAGRLSSEARVDHINECDD